VGERIFSYGARGTPTTFALEDAMCELEGGERAFVYPTGLAAVAGVLLAILEPGDHVAVIDTVYPPVRRLCDTFLAARGIETCYFAPDVEGLEAVMQPNTRVVFAESPGSWTFEVLDLPAIAAVARRHEAVLAVDNTWAAGFLHRPLCLGADISIQAATKYICGHSDVMLGIAVARDPVWTKLLDASTTLGLTASPDDCYLALRGLRSLAARLRQHGDSGLRIAHWLDERSEVAVVRHPALPGNPGHAFWQRDFTGASGLFAFCLRQDLVDRTDRFVNALSLFGIGSSWGGYESLALPIDPAPIRTARPWQGPERIIRLHAGLEDCDDLITDIEQAFNAAVNGCA
jgi:cystathionine beta-lyase